MYSLADPGSLPVPHDDGHFISAEISRIVELIREYSQYLEVKWIPPELREPGDAAFAIVEHTSDGRVLPIFKVQTEEEFDHRVLARIYSSDNSKANVLDNIDAQNMAIREIQRKKHKDEMDEAHDVAVSILKSGRATYRHKGRVYE